jgi:hypothetical protein
MSETGGTELVVGKQLKPGENHKPTKSRFSVAKK